MAHPLPQSAEKFVIEILEMITFLSCWCPELAVVIDPQIDGSDLHDKTFNPEILKRWGRLGKDKRKDTNHVSTG